LLPDVAEDVDGFLRPALSAESPDLIGDDICKVKGVQFQVFQSSCLDEP